MPAKTKVIAIAVLVATIVALAIRSESLGLLQSAEEDGYTPPDDGYGPIHFRDNATQLTLRCSTEDKLEALLIARNGRWISDDEVDAMREGLMRLQADEVFVPVRQVFDGREDLDEGWAVDLSGAIASAPNPIALVERLKSASSYSVVIAGSGGTRTAEFHVLEKIPDRWSPCL